MNSQDKIIRRRLIQPRQLPPKVHGSLPDFIAICLGLSELRYRWSCRDQKVRANMLHHYSTYAPLIYVLRSLGSASTSRVQSRVDCGQQARASALTSSTIKPTTKARSSTHFLTCNNSTYIFVVRHTFIINTSDQPRTTKNIIHIGSKI